MKLCEQCKAAQEAERKAIKRAILDEKPIQIPEGMGKRDFQINLHNTARSLHIRIVTKAIIMGGKPSLAIWQVPAES